MVVYENIEKALEAIKYISLTKGSPTYYRGQNKDYRITSSLHRLSSDEDIENEAIKTNAFIQWIKKRNTLLPSAVAANGLLHGTDLVYWAIAQHYGYKTDLIDFTTNLETAMAFSLLGRKVGSNGVIYCLWEDDIQDIINLCLYANSSFDPQSRELLESVNYNPFFAFQIDELSRITNQHGLFLWDLNAIISSYWNQDVMNDEKWIDSHCFYFHQTDTNIDISVLRAVYPEPNYVELIIDQYVQVENHHFFYKNYGELLNSAETVDPLSTKYLLNHFEENDFSMLHRFFYHEENLFYPHDGMETLSIDIDFSFITQLEDGTTALKFIKSWLQHLSDNKYYIFTSSDPIVKLYSELINEVLALKGIFPAFIAEGLSVILQKVISILGSLLIIANNNSPQSFANAYARLSEYQFNLNDPSCSIDQILDIVREQVCLNDLATDIWGDECVFLKVIGSNNTTSLGVLPLQFVNDLSRDYRKYQLEKLQLLYEQGLLSATQIAISQSGEVYRISKDKESLSLKDLFNYVSMPAVLFDADDMLRIMHYCFIPWQIVMCPKRSRLYNPLEYKEIRLMENENIPNSIVSVINNFTMQKSTRQKVFRLDKKSQQTSCQVLQSIPAALTSSDYEFSHDG